MDAAPPEYLQDEIRERLDREPVRFRLLARLAAADDPVDDPTVAWPDGEREEVELGVLELTGLDTTRETGDESSLSRPSSVASKLPSYTTSSSHSRFRPSAIGSPALRSPGLMWPPMPSEYCLRSRRSADARSRCVRKYLSPWWNTT